MENSNEKIEANYSLWNSVNWFVGKPRRVELTDGRLHKFWNNKNTIQAIQAALNPVPSPNEPIGRATISGSARKVKSEWKKNTRTYGCLISFLQRSKSDGMLQSNPQSGMIAFVPDRCLMYCSPSRCCASPRQQNPIAKKRVEVTMGWRKVIGPVMRNVN